MGNAGERPRSLSSRGGLNVGYLDEASEPSIYRMKNGREIRHEDTALCDVMAGLTSDRVHDEIRYFQRRLTRTFRHKVAFDWYRLPVLFEAEALHRVLNQRVRALAGFENDMQFFEWRGSRYIYDPIL
jgi:hypothetical protein